MENGDSGIPSKPEEEGEIRKDLLNEAELSVEVQDNNGVLPLEMGTDTHVDELSLVPVEIMGSSLTTAEVPTSSSGYTRVISDADYVSDYDYNSYSCDDSEYLKEVPVVSDLGSNVATSGGSTLSSDSNGYKNDSDDKYENMKDVFEEANGLAGLHNLKNTCYMNSALQCLVHTPQLVEYFRNKDNPVGMKGELALVFGSLLEELWHFGCKPVRPYEFKKKVGALCEQFSGYDQHDIQEFLAFLLDKLHEDLKRAKEKDHIEAQDNGGCPDREVADEGRDRKADNDSVIVSTFQGQYKSTLVCLVCGKISMTFDPFMNLSLPLPSRALLREMAVTVFYGDGSTLPLARLYTVTVPEIGCCTDLQNALGAACCLKKDEYLLLAEVFDHRIFQYFDDHTEPLTSIEDSHCIVAYILPERAFVLPRLEICHRQLERTMSNTRVSQRKVFSTPLVTFLEDPRSGADIHLVVSRILSPLRREPTEEKEYKLLFIMNDDSINSTPIEKDTPIVIEPGEILKVMLDWSQEDEELHDIRCLGDIPKGYHILDAEKKAMEEPISLFSCLDEFIKEEPLGANNMWNCPHCKEPRKATKKLDLWRLPDILVFHLKRFTYLNLLKVKLDAFVDFPLQNLDLSEYVKCNDASGKSYIYDLYAMSKHEGEGSNCGHYTAYCKCNEDKWYQFNDAIVTPVEEYEVMSSAAYMLFYKRVDAKHSNGKVEESSQGLQGLSYSSDMYTVD